MEIKLEEYFDTEDYILHIPVVRIINEDSIRNFLDSEFLSEVGLTFTYVTRSLSKIEREREIYKIPCDEFIEFMLNRDTLEFVAHFLWHESLEKEEILIQYEKRNNIIKKLIEIGILELK